MYGRTDNRRVRFEEKKKSKKIKVLLMKDLRDLMICEGALVACAKRRDAHCFFRFFLEQISAPALNTCTKTLREGSKLGKTLFLHGLMSIHRSKLLRVNMKEPVELEP